MPATVAPEAVMAIALFEAGTAGKGLEIEDISRLFVVLQERGLSVGKVALRRVPRGVYSEDVEAFVGRLEEAGYATSRSPVKCLEGGMRICEEIVREELQSNPENFRNVAQALNFDLSRITSPATA